MPWLSLTFKIGSEHADELSDHLLTLGALSVDVHDAEEGTEQEQPLFGEPGEPSDQLWRQIEITALFVESCNLDVIKQEIADITGTTVSNYILQQVAEQDWVRLTQQQFEPIRISPRLWIVPSWHELSDPAAINLRLDPGLAFGTGSHPSTYLCLSWLDKYLSPGDVVLDYGCGSGILAIAALKLGADKVLGVDIDSNAITASRENAEKNSCDPTKLMFDTVLTALEVDSENHSGFSVIVANILANPLIMLAPILTRALRSRGRIVLSGILETQADEVIRAYSQWVEMRIAVQEQEWVLLTGVRS